MQALVSALVDSARGRVAWVALSKGEEVPDEAAVRVLRQLKHEAEWRLRCPTPTERHVELYATGEARSSLPVSFALLQVENRLPALDFSTGALGLNMRCRARVQASTSSRHSSRSNRIEMSGKLPLGEATRAR